VLDALRDAEHRYVTVVALSLSVGAEAVVSGVMGIRESPTNTCTSSSSPTLSALTAVRSEIDSVPNLLFEHEQAVALLPPLRRMLPQEIHNIAVWPS
jgi:hypothetical protein